MAAKQSVMRFAQWPDDQFLKATKGDDFIGVRAYNANELDRTGCWHQKTDYRDRKLDRER